MFCFHFFVGLGPSHELWARCACTLCAWAHAVMHGHMRALHGQPALLMSLLDATCSTLLQHPYGGLHAVP